VLILGIDTSTSAIGVGLSDGGGRTASAHRLDARGHTEHLAPLVAALLAEQGVTPRDLTGIIVGNGPGPFTGLRVGIVTGLTMGHALGIPVHGVCSLDVLAEQAAAGATGERSWDGFRDVSRDGSGRGAGRDLLVATDARRKEVYWARYRVGATAERVEGPAVDRPAELPEDVRSLPTVGRGPLLFPHLFPRPVGPLDVDAGVLARLGVGGVRAGRDLPVEPLYLRRPDALTTAERGVVG
jgi:tRNA threonylcarbamoyl adenosine modification protein YeaZ